MDDKHKRCKWVWIRRWPNYKIWWWKNYIVLSEILEEKIINYCKNISFVLIYKDIILIIKNNKYGYVDKNGKLVSEQFINKSLDFVNKNINEFSNLYYSVAYDIENNKLLKVKNVKNYIK